MRRMMSTRALEGFLDGCGALYAAMLFQSEQMLLEIARKRPGCHGFCPPGGQKAKSGSTARKEETDLGMRVRSITVKRPWRMGATRPAGCGGRGRTRGDPCGPGRKSSQEQRASLGDLRPGPDPPARLKAFSGRAVSNPDQPSPRPSLPRSQPISACHPLAHSPSFAGRLP